MSVIDNINVKNYRFKHTCNNDNDIGRRKQQKLDYHIFTCKFPISYITMSADHDINICCFITLNDILAAYGEYAVMAQLWLTI